MRIFLIFTLCIAVFCIIFFIIKLISIDSYDALLITRKALDAENITDYVRRDMIENKVSYEVYLRFYVGKKELRKIIKNAINDTEYISYID